MAADSEAKETPPPADRDRRFRRPAIENVEGEEREAGLPARPAEDLEVLLRPMVEMAEAFRSNTEALRSIAENQEKLGKRLLGKDRSEAVIQSTQALNETFRGVQRTQERLMGRLAVEKRRPWLFLAAGVLLVVVVAGAALWFLLDWFAAREESTTRTGAEAFAGTIEKKDRSLESLTAENRRLAVELARSEEKVGLLTDRVRGLTDRVEALDLENGNLREGQLAADEVRGEKDRLALEVERLQDELVAARRELKTASDDLEEAKKELARLKAAPAAGPDGGRPAPGPEKPAVPEKAARDPAELARVRDLLNRLLAESGGEESYRFEKIGGIRGKVLFNVVIVDRAARGREGKKFEAEEARVVVEEARRRVEIRLRSGTITYYGVRARFWDDRYVLPLADVDTELWIRSGLTIFTRGA